ncbi:MAG TPA: response regulator [Candidatus Limnocylindria bacterium]
MRYVLIAEDDPAIARLLGEGIGEIDDVETDVIMNGALVPDALAARRPDLLVLDVSLPGLSGLDIFDLVRNDPQWEGVPVLFLTASPEKARGAFAPTGVRRVMAKPFEIDALVAAVRLMLGEPRKTEVAA